MILRTQGIHPFNPEGFDAAPWDVTFNTTSSFISNTNWQYYGGETTLSYFSQMTGLAVQNFISAAVGIAVAVAVIRGFAARSGAALGNFWQDLTRTLLYVLLPISFVGRAAPRLAGRDPDPRPYRRSARSPAGADARTRPGRLAGGDQDARHQRRRLLQRQQRDAVREPDRALELPRDAAHPGDPRRGSPACSGACREPPPGLGDLRRDARPVPRLRRRGLRRRGERVAGSAPPASTAPKVAGGNLEGKEVRFGLARPRCSPRSRPSHRAARSMRPSTR